MPRLSCSCGKDINLSAIPNPQGFRIFWEPRMESLVTALLEVRANPKPGTELERQIYQIFREQEPVQAYECANCGRLWVFARGLDSRPSLIYRPEEDQHERVSLRSLFPHRENE
jgi:hypothetical protein